jgi:hypothetical protein
MSAVTLSAPVGNPVVAGPTAANAQGSDRGFSFGDLLDIVNPLQHIPVVSTIYRAITGDQIKTFPKIAGDMLSGGVAGFFSSVADTIFEKITGKNVGDTVLAWVEGEFSKPAAAVASATPALPQPTVAAAVPASPDTIVIPGKEALLMALTGKNIDQGLALRAAAAYRNTLNVAGTAAATALY